MSKEIIHKDFLGQDLEYGDVVLMTEMENNGFNLGIVVGYTPLNLRVMSASGWWSDLNKTLKGACKHPGFVIKHPLIPNQDIDNMSFTDTREVREYLKELENYE